MTEVEMVATDTALQEYMETWARADDEQQEFRETVGGGKLYKFLETHNGPDLAPIAQIMRRGVEPPKMALDDWLVEGELHWVFADAEAGKTWLALHLSILVMEQSGIVVYFDEELGAGIIAERLIAIGADPALVETNFVYAPFPAWEMTPESHDLHRDFMQALRPQLVVYDTVTDMLAAADLDENYGREVTAWVKAYPEEARKAGAAQLVLDHVGLANKNRVVGSRAKRAKAKVMYKLGSVRGSKTFSPTEHGEVELTLDKNTRGAEIPKKRMFRIGGSPFLWEETFNSRLAEDITTTAKISAAIRQAVADTPGLGKTALLDSVKGAKDAKADMFERLVEASTIRTEPGPKNSIKCYPVT